jgi:aldose sugar dehydrogenase
MRLLPAISIMSVALAGCGGDKKVADGPGRQVAGEPLETGPANAPEQRPAFEGQTRAPYRTANVPYEPRPVASGLEHPWALSFLPDGTMVVTERPGRMRLVTQDGQLSSPVRGLPEVDSRGQGGLLDVVPDPNHTTNGLIYWSYAEPRGGDDNGTAVARARLVRDNPPRVDNIEVIFRMKPDLASTMHFGSRLVFSPDGEYLFIGLGERSIDEGRHQAQRLDSHFGKVVRIRPDGSVPDDNPFVNRDGALPEIWSIGHRNIQAAALHPETGQLWVVEHGAKGGDEINVVERGKDYGWPTIAYGREYDGDPIGKGITQAPGMEQPIYYWDPILAPSGMLFYTGDLFPAWKGSLLVGGLAAKHISRLTLEGRRVVGEERILPERSRIRDLAQGPDGAIYVVTDHEDGELLKLVPREGSGQTAQR